jgi:hypothetical protein
MATKSRFHSIPMPNFKSISEKFKLDAFVWSCLSEPRPLSNAGWALVVHTKFRKRLISILLLFLYCYYCLTLWLYVQRRCIGYLSERGESLCPSSGKRLLVVPLGVGLFGGGWSPPPWSRRLKHSTPSWEHRLCTLSHMYSTMYIEWAMINIYSKKIIEHIWV